MIYTVYFAKIFSEVIFMAKKYEAPQFAVKNCEIPEVLNGSTVVDPTPQEIDVDMLVADLF